MQRRLIGILLPKKRFIFLNCLLWIIFFNLSFIYSNDIKSLSSDVYMEFQEELKERHVYIKRMASAIIYESKTFIYKTFNCDYAYEGIHQSNAKNEKVLILLIKKDNFLTEQEAKCLSCENLCKIKINFRSLLGLSKRSYTNIFRLVDVFEFKNYYCIIQERPESLSGVEIYFDDNSKKNFYIKRLILSYMYNIAYLHSKKIFIDGHLDFYYQTMDKNFNTKNSMFFEYYSVEVLQYGLKKYTEYYLYQNTHLESFVLENCKNSCRKQLEKKYKIKDYEALKIFIKNLVNNLNIKGKEKLIHEKNEFIKFLNKMDVTDDNFIREIVQHRFFEKNIIIIEDFRERDIVPSYYEICKIKKRKDTLIIVQFDSGSVIKIKVDEKDYGMILGSNKIHYRSLTVHINNSLQDFDIMDEKSFKTLKEYIYNFISLALTEI